MFRYFAFAWNPLNRQADHDVALLIQRLLQSDTQWRAGFRGEGIAVYFATDKDRSADRHMLEGGRGIVCGPLFGRSDGCDVARRRQGIRLDSNESARIVETGGRRLITSYWGSYVAFLVGEHSESRVIRAPAGSLPCLTTSFKAVRLFSRSCRTVWRST